MHLASTPYHNSRCFCMDSLGYLGMMLGFVVDFPYSLPLNFLEDKIQMDGHQCKARKKHPIEVYYVLPAFPSTALQVLIIAW